MNVICLYLNNSIDFVGVSQNVVFTNFMQYFGSTAIIYHNFQVQQIRTILYLINDIKVVGVLLRNIVSTN